MKHAHHQGSDSHHSDADGACCTTATPGPEVDHDHAACHLEAAANDPVAMPVTHHAHHGQGGGSLARLTTAATLHCLLGCAIGEFIGLALGVSLGLGVWPTMALATALGFASGFAFSLVPLMRTGMTLASAWRAIWLGETLSIAAMEFAMNFADYHVGGMAVGSVADPMFWAGYGVALVAGFAVAWPVNRWMLGREIKKPCH